MSADVSASSSKSKKIMTNSPKKLSRCNRRFSF